MSKCPPPLWHPFQWRDYRLGPFRLSQERNALGLGLTTQTLGTYGISLDSLPKLKPGRFILLVSTKPCAPIFGLEDLLDGTNAQDPSAIGEPSPMLASPAPNDSHPASKSYAQQSAVRP
ncbi:hypothetical protein LQV05_001084 [Cryptococcus neoformans]|nr:hypothetical protein J007_05250 [Cryptococcus neoformans var. grubii]OXC59188.1 hypothetical protein C358_05370 [Cryptococcus neoformans var. grubii MW-RSA852]UOH84289.1 hypothetical protein LQV05_001084 [Cryptococcus neoformans]